MSDQVNRSGNELPCNRKIDPANDLDKNCGAVNPAHCPPIVSAMVREDNIKAEANRMAGHHLGCRCEKCEMVFQFHHRQLKKVQDLINVAFSKEI